MGELVNVLTEVYVQKEGPSQGGLILKQEACQGQLGLLARAFPWEGYTQLVQGGDYPRITDSMFGSLRGRAMCN